MAAPARDPAAVLTFAEVAPARALDPRHIRRRSVVFAVVVAAGLWVPLRRSVADLDSQSPLALVGWALPLAVMVALHGLRSEPDPTEARPARAADAFIAACCVAVGLICAFAAPSAFGWDAATARPDLLAAPGLLAGWIVLFFGSRALWLARRGIAVAVAACPVWYGGVVAPLQRIGVDVAWPVLRGLGAVLDVRVTHAAGLRGVGFSDGTLVVVGATCAGASSVLGVGLVLGAASAMLHGSVRRKAAWVLVGAALALAGNVVRLAALVTVGALVSPSVSLRLVHPVAGVISSLVTTGIALALSDRFGLHRRPVQRSVDQRLAHVAPRRITVAALVAVAVAAGANVAYASIWQLDRLGGSSAVVNDDAAVVLPEVAARLGLVAVEAEPISWVEQFYGDATWRRFVLFDPASPAAAPITVDLTTASERAAIERLDLAACYGFHGLQADHELAVDGMGERPAERFAFDEDGGRTEVLTWQTRVSAGVQRVVVSQLAGDRSSVLAVAAALSAATPLDPSDPSDPSGTTGTTGTTEPEAP
ncbi:MAG: archaeosortase/exosortase family protein [Acidimicrobiales bacterium]